MLLVKSIGVCATLGSDLNFPLFGPKDYVKSKNISRSVCVLLLATPWTVSRQTPLSIGFSRQEYWIG